MLWILKALQHYSRMRRRIFGKNLPHWLKDALSLVQFVNVIDLIPTLLAITLSPEHFYKRVPQYVKSKNTWIKTPLKFLTSSIALIIIILFNFAKDMLADYNITDEKAVFWYLAFICLSAPLTLPFICLLFRICLGLVMSFPGYSQQSGVSSSILSNLLIPLSPWTYVRLEYKRFFWSIFYFGVYFYIGLQVFQLIGFYLGYFELEFVSFLQQKTDECMSFISKIDPNHVVPQVKIDEYLEQCRNLHNYNSGAKMFPAQVLSFGVFGLLILIGYSILINPYLWLLRASVKIPTKRMHRSDCYSVSDWIGFITAKKGREKYLTIKQAGQLERSVGVLEKNVIAQDRRAFEQAPGYIETLRKERGNVYGKMLSTDNLRGVLEYETVQPEVRECMASLADRIDRLSASMTGIRRMST
jgi:hypothetical protein